MPSSMFDQKLNCMVLAYWPPWEDVPGGIRLRRLLGGLRALGWNHSLVTSGSLKPERFMQEVDSCLVLPRLFRSIACPVAQTPQKIPASTSEAARVNGLRIVRDQLAFSLRNLPIPRKAGWLAWYPKILNWAKSQHVDIVYSKSQPSSSHFLGRLISQHLGVPWVAELGDLWSQNPYYDGMKSWSRAESAMERWVLKPAKGLVTVSAPMAGQLSRLHNKPTEVVYNCFPRITAESALVNESYELSLPLKILYAGRVYPKYRTPQILLEAIQNLLKRGAISPNELELDFLCSNHGWLARWMQKNYASLSGICSIMPPVSLEEALKRQRQSHVLLTIGWFGQGHEGVVTSKFFEYLGSGRKMLCILKAGGALESIGRQIPGVELLHDIREAEEAVMRLVMEARKGSKIALPHDYWEKARPYSCKEQAKRLSNFLMRHV